MWDSCLFHHVQRDKFYHSSRLSRLRKGTLSLQNHSPRLSIISRYHTVPKESETVPDGTNYMAPIGAERHCSQWSSDVGQLDVTCWLLREQCQEL